MEIPKKLLIFSQKKAFLIFQKMENPKKLFIFQNEIPKPQNQKISYISQKKVMNKFF